MADILDNIHKVCNDKRECFGRRSYDYKCMILNDVYPNGKCPFCKENRGNDGVRIKDDFKAGKPHSYFKR